MELVFATNNFHKLTEIKQLLPSRVILLNLNDISCYTDIPETHMTIEENALEKATFIYEKYKKNCFADDTGLEIEALNGEPGVFSARFAGPGCSFEDNIQKVIKLMDKKKNRRATFRTIIALILKGEIYTFEGIVKGEILSQKRGNKGFGYDPIFKPSGYNYTFAEMSLDQKNEISHRGIAVKKFINFLEKKVI